MNTKLIDFKKCDIFTPENISQLMASKLNNDGNLLEPSVGTGNLLKFIDLDNYETVDAYELKKEYLEHITNIKINKYNQDFLKSTINKKYNNIIMNPPYIKIQDMTSEYVEYLKTNFSIIKNGLVDIYYAFIIKCLDLLSENGVMVAITPNTYLYNKTSYNLRKHLFDNQYIKEIIDFKDKKVFDNASVYCCITVFTKIKNKHIIYNGEKILYSNILKNYSLFDFNTNKKTLKDICKITNGIATLRDKIYIHQDKLYDEKCWKNITNGKIDKYIIYPYNDGKLIKEDIFKKENPLTYKYLCENKDELKKRDKGKKKYKSWYAYGRTQAIKYCNKKCIYIPCFLDSNNIKNNLFIKENILHQSCLRIEPNENIDINIIIKCINNNIEYIVNNSTKRSGGWISLSGRTLYRIPLDQ